MIYEIEEITCNQKYYVLRVIMKHSKPALLMSSEITDINNYIQAIHKNNKEQFKEKVTIITRQSTCILNHHKKREAG